MTGERDQAAFAQELLTCVQQRTRASGGSAKRAALAKAISVSPSSLYAYLNGTTLPPSDVLDRLLTELGVPPPEQHRLATARDAAELSARTVRRRQPKAGPSDGPVRVPPRQLPAHTRCFTGREAELAALDTALGGESAVAVVTGVGGVGKTTLAVQWAHRNADRFPDGQLYVDLRGFAPEVEPLRPETAITRFLYALGVEPSTVPADADAQVDLYRSLLAGRRLLVVLDNARDAEQVASLLPGSPTCATLVTSRASLSGVVATHGARLVRLDVLGDGGDRDLLARHLGEARVDAEPGAVAELLAVCAGLPLAVGVVASRAAAHPDFPLGVLAAELRAAEARLDGLHVDGLASLPAVFASSYRALDDRAARLFRLLGIAPGADVTTAAAASLAGDIPAAVAATLHQLETASLLGQPEPGRYRMHDLVRLYAVDRARHDEAPARRHAAVDRAIDHYLHTAFRCDRLLAPLREPIALEAPAAGVTVAPLADDVAATTWLVAEHATLLATQRLAIDVGRHPAAWQLAWSLDNVHYRRGLVRDHVATWRLGLVAAERAGYARAELLACRRLGAVVGRAGSADEAMEFLRRGLAIAESRGDVAGEADVSMDLAVAFGQRGDDDTALRHSTRAAELYRSRGDARCEANALNNVGWFSGRVGRHDEARQHCERSLRLHREHGDRESQAGVLDSLGHIEHAAGRPAVAVRRFTESLAILRELEHVYSQADSLAGLGDAHAALGQTTQARAAWTAALDHYTTQHRTAEATLTRAKLADVPPMA